jgi:hypothetical protein
VMVFNPFMKTLRERIIVAELAICLLKEGIKETCIERILDAITLIKADDDFTWHSIDKFEEWDHLVKEANKILKTKFKQY